MPNTARRLPPPMTVDEFLAADQSALGSAWRYELLDGQPEAQAAPSPEHGAIVVNIGAALKARLRGGPCRVEAGSAVVPRNRGGDRVRIPDLTVRCAGRPTILFEVTSPSDGHSQLRKALRYDDLKSVDGVREIVEIVQDEPLCRIHRWRDEIAGWQMLELSGAEAVLDLATVGIGVPFAEIYDGVPLEGAAGGAA